MAIWNISINITMIKQKKIKSKKIKFKFRKIDGVCDGSFKWS